MVLLISYDLVGQERPAPYDAVRRYIEKHATSHRRPLYSQWLVETGFTPQAWVDAFRKNDLVDGDDRLFICEVRQPFQGLLSDADWEWLRSRVLAGG